MNLKYPIYFVVSATLFTLCDSATAQKKETKQQKTENSDTKELKSTLVSVKANAGYDRNNKDLKGIMFQNSQAELELSYLLETKNIVQILKDSAKFKGDSKDWQFDTFPRISDTANAAIFTITRQGNFINKQNGKKMHGTVDLKTGKKLITKDLILPSFDKPVKVDEFTFIMKKDSLKVRGKHELIKKITLTSNGKELESRSSSWSDGSKTYYYQGLNKGTKGSFTYWDGLEIKKVSFSY